MKKLSLLLMTATMVANNFGFIGCAKKNRSQAQDVPANTNEENPGVVSHALFTGKCEKLTNMKNEYDNSSDKNKQKILADNIIASKNDITDCVVFIQNGASKDEAKEIKDTAQNLWDALNMRRFSFGAPNKGERKSAQKQLGQVINAADQRIKEITKEEDKK